MGFRFRWVAVALLVAALVIGGLLAPASAQDAPGEDLLRSLVQFLRTTLGRPVNALDNYSYQVISYPDSALGCPEPGKSYVPGPFPAYKFLLTVQGITYDVRTTLDNTRTVLCTSSEIKQTVSLSLYRNREFSILYPTPWNVTERAGDIYFGLAPNPICAQPGMTVTLLGPANGQLPEALLNEYAVTVYRGEFEADRLSIGRIGRSVLYGAPCTDGSPRKHRVTVFVAYGRAYRVLQFAPAPAFGQWADVFLQILEEFGPTTIGSVDSGSAIRLPEVSPLAAVAHIFGGNVYRGTLADLPGTPITTGATAERAYKDVVISPRGDRLAFVDPFERALYMASVDFGQPRKLAAGLATGVLRGWPVAWSPDGDEIAYVADEEERYTLIAAAADGTGTRRIGDLEVSPAGCVGIGTSDPAAHLYAAEAGYPGHYARLLAWARDGNVYYSLACGIGVGRIAVTDGATAVLHPELYRARLSPDGAALAGLINTPGEGPTLARISLTDGQISVLKTAAPPDVVAWGPEGRVLYYSSAVLKEVVTLDAEADRARGEAFFGVWPFRITVYDVSLRRLELTAGVDELLFRAEGRGIGSIAPSPDGAGVLFTFVPGATLLAEAFQNNASAGELWRQAPVTRLYWWPNVVGGDPFLVAFASAPVWGPPGSALAPTPTGGPPKTPLPESQTPPPTWTPLPTSTPLPTITPTSAFGTPLPTNTPRPTSESMGAAHKVNQPGRAGAAWQSPAASGRSPR